MIPPGSRLAHYEIVSALGKGGMGEVWRALDTKLGREVAIKTLPSEFAQDAERLARFEREAKLLASLNHPNIAAIYGLEEHAASRFLVLELVEGDTLADRLRRGAIPVEESLEIALQIAGALEAAHEKGVIHRDLKPANIKITPESKVKVLDFGLAKAFVGDQPEAGMSNSPTLSMQATQAGIILGTAAYMSPEQAKGRATDKRTDVWAFGCVVYEMLTGRPVFAGEDVSTVLARVLERDPDFALLPQSLHPRLRECLERCLAKDAGNRYHDVGDVRVDLERVRADPRGGTTAPAAASRHPVRSWLIPVGAAVAGAALAWALHPQPVRTPPTVTRFHDTLEDGVTYRGVGRNVMAISRDGRQTALNLIGPSTGLFMRAMGEDLLRLVPGTEQLVINPFFSPDGEWIAFADTTALQLRRIRVTGGAAVTITNLEGNFYGASWNDDDTILYGENRGIVRVSADGGEPEVVIPAQTDEVFWDPQLLPNGDVLFAAFAAGQPGVVAVERPGSADRTDLFAGEHPTYLATGHIVAADPVNTPNTLFARTFDPDTREAGGPVPMAEGVFQTTRTQYTVSDSGTLVFPAGVRSDISNRVLALVGIDGSTVTLDVPPGSYVHPRLSPDGTRLAVQTVGEPSRIWIYDLSEDTQIRPLTLPQEGNNIRPIWTLDGQSVTFSSDRGGAFGIWMQRVDRSEPARQLTEAEAGTEHWPDDWSPDGTLAYTVSEGQNADSSLWFVNPDTGIGPEEFYDIDGSQEIGAEFSPDGQWVAYSSGPAGLAVVHIQNLATGATYEISSGTAAYPLWPNGEKIFYRPIGGGAGSGSTALIARDIFTDPEVRFTAESDVRIGTFSTVLYNRSFDTLDGETFLVTLPASAADVGVPLGATIHYVLNWDQELLERVPVD